MGRDERRRRESRLASTAEFAGRSRDSSSPFSDAVDGGDSFYDHRRSSCWSPTSETPPRRSPNPYRPCRRGRDDGRRWSSYNDRVSRNGKRSGPGDGDSSSEDEEDLKGLSYFEYRRLKRYKLRKRLKNCIWRVSPSPPLDEPNGAIDSPAEEKEEAEENKSGKDRRGSSESDDSDGSASESASEGWDSDSESPSRKRGGVEGEGAGGSGSTRIRAPDRRVLMTR